MRSVVVVLPASMWAMMPIFLVRSRSFGFAIRARYLPAVMAERSVRLRHSVSFVALSDRRSGVVRGVEELGRQLFSHALAAAPASRGDQPAHGQRLLAVTFDLDGHLVGGAANTAGLDFEQRRGIAERRIEDLDGVTSRGSLDVVERRIDDAFGQRLL